MSDTGIDQFLQAWAAELALTLAPALREVPLISCSRARHLTTVDRNGLLWVQMSLDATPAFDLWIGAREPLWSVVGKLDWIRLLESNLASTVAQLRPNLLHPVTCRTAQVVFTAPDTESLCYALVGIRLSHTELPALLFALDPNARAALHPKNAAPVLTPMLRRLLDLELPLSVALGRAKLPIGEVLKITSGSVIRLDRHAGEEVEVLVHGTLVAKGEVVSSKGTYGVRIKQIISPRERLDLCPGEAD